jgi:hypothetical protein
MENNQPLTVSEGAGSPAREQEVIQKLSLLHAENAEVAATFWEWRHKVMNRFFTAFAAIAVVSGWVYERKEIRRLLFIPLLFGAVYCLISYLMDRVNRKILLGCYATGKESEQQLGSVGAYTRTLDQYKSVNYSVFLRALYLSAAALLLVASVLAAVFYAL